MRQGPRAKGQGGDGPSLPSAATQASRTGQAAKVAACCSRTVSNWSATGHSPAAAFEPNVGPKSSQKCFFKAHHSSSLDARAAGSAAVWGPFGVAPAAAGAGRRSGRSVQPPRQPNTARCLAGGRERGGFESAPETVGVPSLRIHENSYGAMAISIGGARLCTDRGPR